jgi:cytochrome c peroxidase
MDTLLSLILVSIFIYLVLTSLGKKFISGNLNRLVSRYSKGITIAVVIVIAIVSGHIVSAQTGPPPLASLKGVQVPEPDNLKEFIKDRTAAIKLGKAFFWDMQVGSDGLLSCASCHFHAGADNRSKNQINPGFLANPKDTTFQVGSAANYQLLQPGDFPFHKLADPTKRDSAVLSDSNDVTSSQGIFNVEFKDVVPGQAEDKVETKPDQDGFSVAGTNVRRVEPRNTPTMINAVYNHRNFWDGRAQDIFNGVNPFGLRDPNASVGKADNPSKLDFVKISLKNSSLASQAVGPPLSSFEMSADGRTFEEIGDKFGDIDKKSKSATKGKKLPRKLGKKLLPLRPLGKQVVHPEDSVLSAESRSPQPGVKTATYEKLIEDAFNSEWWKSNRMIQIDQNGQRSVVKKPDRSLATNEYTLMEYNFPLFFGLAVQMYESTLVSDDTPFDRGALNAQQQRGKELFEGRAACIACHSGAEFTSASVSSVKQQGRIATFPLPTGQTVFFDRGFFNIGVRPTSEDLGVGGNDGVGTSDQVGNPLSETRLAQQGKFNQLLGEAPNITPANGIVNPDGAFKTPGLRNVELTAPYFHNGGQLTLRQVVEFYNRGGDFSSGVLGPITPSLSNAEIDDLVAFLTSLTDERVRLDKAPFDHPQLFVTNGHPGNTSSVTNDGTGKATDTLLEIPAVGRNGKINSTPNFLQP